MVHVEVDETVRSADHATRELAPPHGILSDGSLDFGLITIVKPRIKQSLTPSRQGHTRIELLYLYEFVYTSILRDYIYFKKILHLYEKLKFLDIKESIY